MALERIIKFEPAFDKRHTDPNKNYGIHGVNLRALVKGPDGAVQFVLFTHWMLPHVQKEREHQVGDHALCSPLPADLGYHSPRPMYDGQTSNKKCEFLNGQECYYDGSGLAADAIYEALVRDGDSGLWRELEKYYKEVFSKEAVK